MRLALLLALCFLTSAVAFGKEKGHKGSKGKPANMKNPHAAKQGGQHQKQVKATKEEMHKAEKPRGSDFGRDAGKDARSPKSKHPSHSKEGKSEHKARK